MDARLSMWVAREWAASKRRRYPSAKCQNFNGRKSAVAEESAQMVAHD